MCGDAMLNAAAAGAFQTAAFDQLLGGVLCRLLDCNLTAALGHSTYLQLASAVAVHCIRAAHPLGARC
jgi:hypothetical protein